MSYLFLSCTEIEDINKVQPEYRKAPWFGPQFTAVELSSDQTQREKDVFNAVFAQLTLSKQPEKYTNLKDIQPKIISKMQSLTLLNQYNSPKRVEKVLSKYPNAYSFIPLKSDKEDMVVLLSRDGKIIKVVNLRPWK